MRRAGDFGLRMLLAAYSALWLGGCAQVLGVDDYSNGTNAEPPPFDDKPAYLTGAKCERCVEAKCGDENRACAVNTVCSQWLESMRVNNFGPIADYNRTFFSPLDWDTDADNDPLSVVNALSRCLRKLNAYQDAGCLDRCEIGRDFSCVTENFQWPASSAGSAEILVRLVDSDGNGLPGWNTRFCGTPTCEPADSQQQTDERGIAQLMVKAPASPSRFLLASGEGDSYPFMYPLPAGPVRAGLRLEESAASKSSVDAEFQSVGSNFDPTTAAVWVLPKDCMGNPARRVTVDLFSASKNSWNRCSEADCPRVYPGAAGSVEVGQSDLSLGPRALITNVPPFGTWIVVRDAATRTPVAMQKFDARPGHVHVLTLYPASEPQLQDLKRLPE